jgi:hypothetical protein
MSPGRLKQVETGIDINNTEFLTNSLYLHSITHYTMITHYTRYTHYTISTYMHTFNNLKSIIMNYSEKTIALTATAVSLIKLGMAREGRKGAPAKTHKLTIVWDNIPEGMKLPSSLDLNRIDLDILQTAAGITDTTQFMRYVPLATINVDVHVRIAGKSYAKSTGVNKDVPFTIDVTPDRPAGSLVYHPSVTGCELTPESTARYDKFVDDCAKSVMVDEMKDEATTKAAEKAAAKLALAAKLAAQMGNTVSTPVVQLVPNVDEEAKRTAIKEQLAALNEAVAVAKGAERAKAQATLNDFIASM